MEFLILAAEMEATQLELTPVSGFGALFVVIQLIFGVLFVVVPLGALIYVVVLLRRLTEAVQRIEQHLTPPAENGELSTP